MRYDDRMTFIKLGEEVYDPDTSTFIQSDEELATVPCHVSDLGMDRSMAIFGDYKKGRKVVRLENPYIESYDRVEYQDKLWQVTAQRLSDTVIYLEVGEV